MSLHHGFWSFLIALLLALCTAPTYCSSEATTDLSGIENSVVSTPAPEIPGASSGIFMPPAGFTDGPSVPLNFDFTAPTVDIAIGIDFKYDSVYAAAVTAEGLVLEIVMVEGRDEYKNLMRDWYDASYNKSRAKKPKIFDKSNSTPLDELKDIVEWVRATARSYFDWAMGVDPYMNDAEVNVLTAIVMRLNMVISEALIVNHKVPPEVLGIGAAAVPSHFYTARRPNVRLKQTKAWPLEMEEWAWHRSMTEKIGVAVSKAGYHDASSKTIRVSPSAWLALDAAPIADFSIHCLADSDDYPCKESTSLKLINIDLSNSSLSLFADTRPQADSESPVPYWVPFNTFPEMGKHEVVARDGMLFHELVAVRYKLESIVEKARNQAGDYDDPIKVVITGDVHDGVFNAEVAPILDAMLGPDSVLQIEHPAYLGAIGAAKQALHYLKLQKLTKQKKIPDLKENANKEEL